MPRCYKPSLTLEGLNAKLIDFNRNGQEASNFQVGRTQIVYGDLGGPPASITIANNTYTATLTIDDGTGGWVCTPADSPLKPYFMKVYTIATKPQNTILDYIFQHVSDIDRTGCGGAAGGAGAQGGAGGDPGGVGTSPSSSIWGTPNSAGAATPAAAAAKKEESPPFRFSNSPRKNSRKNRRKNSRKHSRKHSRKNSRRRHRTKQNRY